MKLFCRCDNLTIAEGKCGICQMPLREVSTDLLHNRPTPPITPGLYDNIPPDPKPWRVCPSCGVENTEHKPKCPRANWNVRKDTPRRVSAPETDMEFRNRLELIADRMSRDDELIYPVVTGGALDDVGSRYGMVRRIEVYVEVD